MKVVIIDDQKAMHLVMKRMLSKCKAVEWIGMFQDTETAFAFLGTQAADLLFVDISMPGESGIEFARRARESGLETKLVFVTSHKEYALDAFDVYAYDYIVKPISQERLIGTVERVFAELRAGEREMAGARAYPPLVEPLTKRETEVLLFMSDGMSNRDIAKALELTEGTVKSHVVNIFGKLQVKNRVQAIASGRENRLM
jgi:DNA-binding NarL/FixJ family response regulator